MKTIHEITQGDRVIYHDIDGDIYNATVEHAEKFSTDPFPVLVITVTDTRYMPVKFRTVRNVKCGKSQGTWSLPDENDK